jgi:hypothetical protein
MPCRHHEQQPVAVNARLGGEGEPQEQHDEEIADAADNAEENLEGLADDRAAA